MASQVLILLLLVSLILKISAQNWFAATSQDNEYKKDRTEDDSYLPINDSHSNNFVHDKWKPTNDLHVTNLSVSDTFVQSKYPVKNIIYNNAVKNTNFSRRRLTTRCSNSSTRGKKWRNSNVKPKQRFLGVFQVVQFEHAPCTTTSGLDGTCLHRYECDISGGATMGDCADGYGTCCVMQFSCGGQSSAVQSWFTNPGFPSPSVDRLSCAFALNKTTEDITQIRLDFTISELLPPNYGTCEEDQFVVSGQNVNSYVPILCGVNNNQHMYIEVGDVPGPIYFSIQTVTADSRLFAIKMTQLTASDALSAPSGCLQHFTKPLGYLESFNYQDKSALSFARRPSYMNNLNYAICIQRAVSTCSITYTNADEMQIVNYDYDGLPVIPPAQAGVEILNCPSDWLLFAAARLCGERLNDGAILQDFTRNAPVTDDSAGPIVAWFRSDGATVGRGFRIQYKQNACSNIT